MKTRATKLVRIGAGFALGIFAALYGWDVVSWAVPPLTTTASLREDVLAAAKARVVERYGTTAVRVVGGADANFSARSWPFDVDWAPHTLVFGLLEPRAGNATFTDEREVVGTLFCNKRAFRGLHCAFHSLEADEAAAHVRRAELVDAAVLRRASATLDCAPSAIESTPVGDVPLTLHHERGYSTRMYSRRVTGCGRAAVVDVTCVLGPDARAEGREGCL